MILVLSHPADPHAGAVIDLLRRRGIDVELLDLSDIPARLGVSIAFDDPLRPDLQLRDHDGGTIDLRQVGAVWWRRPQAPNPAEVADQNARWFVASEWGEVLNGLWQLMGGRWMNEPGPDERAAHKPFQLRVAAEVGLSIPRTLMTSDPDRARAFVSAVGVGRTVYKTFAATPLVWRETRMVREDEIAMLDAVRLAPVIFQEYVEAEADLRVTMVGDKIFAMAIDARRTEYPLDFRMSLGQARVEAAELPAEVAGRLRALIARLGLAYGAIDLRRTPAGEHVFLEINPGGEFLFVEERTGQPITAAVADWLARNGSGQPERGP